MNTNAEKREFLGGMIAATIAKAAVKGVVKKALTKVAEDKTIPMSTKAVPMATEQVAEDLQKETQARLEHTFNIEPHLSSRNLLLSIFGLIGEGYILYQFGTDNIPQDFQAEVVPHLMVIVGLITPWYSRFIAKKPLFR